MMQKADQVPARAKIAGASRLAALVALGTAGVMTFLAMPVIAASLAGDLGASERDVGLFSTIQLITLSVGCLLSTILPRSRLRRHGMAALGVMLVCDLLCLTEPGWTMFLVLRGIGGGAGGVAVSQATAAMARTANPERSFGLFLALQTIVSVICFYTLPPVIEALGFFFAYSILFAFGAAALLLALFGLQDMDGRVEQQYFPGNNGADWLRSGGVLLSILCFFTGVGAIWTFVTLLGQGIGLDPAQITLALSLSKLVAFAASFLPGLVGQRFGRIAPILVSAAILLLSVQIFAISGGQLLFSVAAALLSLGWYVIYPFQLGALGQVDRDGRPMLAAAALTGAGLGFGPGLVVLGPGGTTGIYLIAATAFLLSAVAAVAALFRAPFGAPVSAEGAL